MRPANRKRFGYGIRMIAEEAKEYEDKYFRDFTLKECNPKRMFDGFQNGVPDISLYKWKFYTRQIIKKGAFPIGSAGFCDVRNSTIYVQKVMQITRKQEKWYSFMK